MLSEKKQKTIDLILEGKTSKTDIGTLVGVSRQMIYEYLKDPEVQAELDKRLSDIRNQAEKKIIAQIEPVIEELYRIALTGGTRERKDACIYLINRVLGTPRATLEMDDKREDNNSDIDILAAFDAAVNAVKEEKEQKE